MVSSAEDICRKFYQAASDKEVVTEAVEHIPTLGDAATAAGTAIATTPYLGPAVTGTAKAIWGAVKFIADPTVLGATAATMALGGVAKNVISAKVARHLCSDVCKEKFVLDPEKRWRCQKECKRKIKIEIPFISSKDKYKYQRTKKDYSPDEENSK